jgi:hypothetical protein
MMSLIDVSLTAFILLNGARAIAYLPQLVRIHRDPHGAAAVSISTWALFTAANAATAWYALVGFNDRLTAILFALNAAGCAGIVILTAMKRAASRQTQAGSDANEADDVFWSWSRRI